MVEILQSPNMYRKLGIEPGSRQEMEIAQFAMDMYIPGFGKEQNTMLWEYLLPLATVDNNSKFRYRTFLLWGPAGSGKSTALRQFTRAIYMFNNAILDVDSQEPWKVRPEFQNYKPRLPIYVAMGDFRKTILKSRSEPDTSTWEHDEWNWLTNAQMNGLEIIEYAADFCPDILMRYAMEQGLNVGLWPEEVWGELLEKFSELKKDANYSPPEVPVEFIFLAETVGLQKKTKFATGVDRGSELVKSQCKKAARELAENSVRTPENKKVIYTREIVGFVPFKDMIDNSIDLRDVVRQLKDDPNKLNQVIKTKFPQVEVLNGDVAGLIERVLKSAPSNSIRAILTEVFETAGAVMTYGNTEFRDYFFEINKNRNRLPERYKTMGESAIKEVVFMYTFFKWLYANRFGYEGKLVFNPMSQNKVIE